VGTGAPAQAAQKPVQAATPDAPATAPSRPAAAVQAAPTRPQGGPAQPKPWAEFPQTCDGAFAYFCSLLGEAYSGAKHDEKWFALFDAAAQGKDPDEFDAADVQRLFQTIRDGMAK
jgi:hypothetical protein